MRSLSCDPHGLIWPETAPPIQRTSAPSHLIPSSGHRTSRLEGFAAPGQRKLGAEGQSLHAARACREARYGDFCNSGPALAQLLPPSLCLRLEVCAALAAQRRSGDASRFCECRSPWAQSRAWWLAPRPPPACWTAHQARRPLYRGYERVLKVRPRRTSLPCVFATWRAAALVHVQGRICEKSKRGNFHWDRRRIGANICRNRGSVASDGAGCGVYVAANMVARRHLWRRSRRLGNRMP